MKRRFAYEVDNHDAINTTGIFHQSKKVIVEKITKEEKILMKILRAQYYSMIVEELGEEATNEDCEHAFKQFTDELKSSGTIDELLKEYLTKKIDNERTRFLRDH